MEILQLSFYAKQILTNNHVDKNMHWISQSVEYSVPAEMLNIFL